MHQDLGTNGSANRVVELQRAAYLGATGWARQTEYRLRIEATPTRLRLYVDGRLELDYTGPVPNGVLALYDYSQAGALFGGGVADSYLSGREGDLLGLRAAFSDAGILDTHTATIDWGDGETTPGTVSEEEGQGVILGQHTYRDDGDGTVEVCVSDDAGDEHCVEIPVAIDNAAPVLALAVGSAGFVEEAVTLAGSTFTDAGIDDTHQVTVDWGDGANESLPVAGASGSWSFDGSHFYSSPGAYEVAVCVLDDDGGESCDSRGVTLVHRSLDLRLTMSVLPLEARPGQNVVFTLRVENAGTLPATGVVLNDALPAGLTYVSSTLGGVPAAGTVTWNLGALALGAVVSPTVTMQVPATAPFGGTATNTAVVGDDGAAGPDATPGDNAALAAVLFSDALTPIVAISGAANGWSGAEGTLMVLSGVTWNDTTAGQAHTGTIAWGDGQTTAATLTPASGTAEPSAATMSMRRTASTPSRSASATRRRSSDAAPPSRRSPISRPASSSPAPSISTPGSRRSTKRRTSRRCGPSLPTA